MTAASTSLLPAPDDSPVPVTALESALHRAISQFEPAGRRQVLREALRRQLTAHRSETAITGQQAIRVCRATIHQAADPCLTAMRGDVPEGQHERQQPRCPDCRAWRQSARALHGLMVTELARLDDDKPAAPPDEPAPGSWQQRCAAPACGKTFTAMRSSARTCSDACRQAMKAARDRAAASRPGSR